MPSLRRADDLAADADDLRPPGAQVVPMYPSCSPRYGSGISTLTFRPTSSAACVPEQRSAAGLTDSIVPRSSIVMTPSTSVVDDRPHPRLAVPQRLLGPAAAR